MSRNGSLLMVGEMFEYSGTRGKGDPQNVEYISKRLQKLGLVIEGSGIEANVRRSDDPAKTERYLARVAEWGNDDEYYDYGKEPWHVYVGKVISKEHGSLVLTSLEEALKEVRKDFPEPKVLHCTYPIHFSW